MQKMDIRSVLKVTFGPIQLLSLGFVMINAMTVITACSENDRMFWLATPFVFVIAIYYIDKILLLQETFDTPTGIS